MNQFTSVHDVANIHQLVEQALLYKNQPFKDIALGKNQRMGLLFLNPSLRTRFSTQIAARNLGMDVMVLNVGQEGWTLELEDGVIMNGSKAEHIKDAAPVLGSYFNMLGIRTFPSLQNREEDYKESFLKAFIQYCKVPVISLESATLHPLQSLTDIVTLTEHDDTFYAHSSSKPKIVLTWAPHVKPVPQCVANSFAQWINKWNKAEFVITHPENYELDESFTQGTSITTNQEEALQNADYVYVKSWCSYKNYGALDTSLNNWMLTKEKLKITRNAKVLHCLPVRRNVELSDEVLDSPASLVQQQAANRVWAAQAVIAEILKHNKV